MKSSENRVVTNYIPLPSYVKIYTLLPQKKNLFLIIYQKNNNLTHFGKKKYCGSILI